MATYREILMRRVYQLTHDRARWADRPFDALVEDAGRHADEYQAYLATLDMPPDASVLDALAWAFLDGWVFGWNAAINIDGDDDFGDDDDDDDAFDPSPHEPGKALQP